MAFVTQMEIRSIYWNCSMNWNGNTGGNYNTDDNRKTYGKCNIDGIDGNRA